jgi:hypothetical protein
MSLYAQKPGGVEVNLTEYLKDASSNEILSAVPTSTLLSLGTGNNFKEAAKGVLAHRKSELTNAGDNQQAVDEIETGLKIWESPSLVPHVAGIPSPEISPSNGKLKKDTSDDSSDSSKRKRKPKNEPRPTAGIRLKDVLDEESEVEVLAVDPAPAAPPRFPGYLTGDNGIARKPSARVERSRLVIVDEDSPTAALASLNEVQTEWFHNHRNLLRDNALQAYNATPGHPHMKLEAAIKGYIDPFVRDKRNGAKTVVFRVVMEMLLKRHQEFQPAGCNQYEYDMLTDVMTTMFRRKNLGGPTCRFNLQLEKN